MIKKIDRIELKKNSVYLKSYTDSDMKLLNFHFAYVIVNKEIKCQKKIENICLLYCSK